MNYLLILFIYKFLHSRLLDSFNLFMKLRQHDHLKHSELFFLLNLGADATYCLDSFCPWHFLAIVVPEFSVKVMDMIDSLSPRNAFDGDATAESAAWFNVFVGFCMC